MAWLESRSLFKLRCAASKLPYKSRIAPPWCVPKAPLRRWTQRIWQSNAEASNKTQEHIPSKCKRFSQNLRITYCVGEPNSGTELLNSFCMKCLNALFQTNTNIDIHRLYQHVRFTIYCTLYVYIYMRMLSPFSAALISWVQQLSPPELADRPSVHSVLTMVSGKVTSWF